MKKGFTQPQFYPAPVFLKTGAGFTLAELLIVVVLLMLLMLAVLVGWKNQVNRANDSLRKKHLNDIKRTFEEYYNDHHCYPPETILSNCGGPELQPYLTAVPCDPNTKTPYNYVPIDPTNLCLGYRAFAGLLDVNDTDITALGCSGITGCGFGSDWNYGISSGAPVALPGFDPGATPTPTPLPPPGLNACAPGGFCSSYTDPVAAGCPITFADSHCNNACGNPANWCQW